MDNPAYRLHPFFALYAGDHPAWDGIVPGGANKGWLDQYTGALQQDVMDRFGIDLLGALHEDYAQVHALRFGDITPAEEYARKLYIASAGSPCCAKSWELDAEIDVALDPRYANLLKVDPDRWVMLQMRMYNDLLARGASAEEAYTICRPTSNIIANMLLNEGVQRGYHIAHGTTMTGPHAGGLLKNLGGHGYERRLIAVYAPIEARLAMRDHRITHEGFYQVTAEDFTTKANLFPERLPVYFDPACVDDVTLKWKDDLFVPAQDILRMTPETETLHPQMILRFAEEYERTYRAARDDVPTLDALMAVRSAKSYSADSPYSDLRYK